MAGCLPRHAPAGCQARDASQFPRFSREKRAGKRIAILARDQPRKRRESCLAYCQYACLAYLQYACLAYCQYAGRDCRRNRRRLAGVPLPEVLPFFRRVSCKKRASRFPMHLLARPGACSRKPLAAACGLPANFPCSFRGPRDNPPERQAFPCFACCRRWRRGIRARGNHGLRHRLQADI